MRYHFFLHYGWFFQNLEKEGRRTFMHTTVIWITLDVERANVFDVKVAKYVSLSIVRMYVRKYDTCHYPCQKFLQSK